MQRLLDGVYAVIDPEPAPCAVLRLGHKGVSQFPHERGPELARIAQGIEDDQDAGPLFDELVDLGLAASGLPAVDPIIEERLRELGEGFGWRLAPHRGTRDILEMARRHHSCRKTFITDFGQTPVIPEIAVSRCVTATKGLKKDARILLIGDDDILSPILSRLGFDVTVIDIDADLIQFIDRLAGEEGLAITTRMVDLLQPLPKWLVGKFDLVMTDPMSYPNCLTAFLSRACSAVKLGGTVWSCVHPLTRIEFTGVAAALPVRVEQIHFNFSAYYYDHYTENEYRSDYLRLRRVEGDPPYGPGDTMRFEDIISGSLSPHTHGLVDVRTMGFMRDKATTVEALVEVVEQSGVIDLKETRVVRGDEYTHIFFITDEGHVAVSFEEGKGPVGYDVFPFDLETESRLAAVMEKAARWYRRFVFYPNAAHYDPLPVHITT
jgi:hypothetical protein